METIELPTLPPRKSDTHKGDYGKILVIGGSETYIGAPALAAQAAARTGAGLVRIAAPKDLLPAIIAVAPFASGFAWAPSRMKELLAFADEHDALAVGPGLGNSPGVKRLVLELLERHHGPMVLDADALNALATLEVSEWPKRRDWSNVVLTPHMGEYMRLMGAVMKRGGAIAPPDNSGAGAAEAPTAQPAKKPRSLVDDDDAPSTADGIVLDLPAEEAAVSTETPAPAAKPAPSGPDRTPLAELLAKGTGTVVVLKGHRTVTTDGYRFAVNESGNPAMATGGSGDVLAGVIAALLGGAGGIKLTSLEAAVLGVHVHGLAGDLARDAIVGPSVPLGGITAVDIAAYLPKALAGSLAR